MPDGCLIGVPAEGEGRDIGATTGSVIGVVPDAVCLCVIVFTASSASCASKSSMTNASRSAATVHRSCASLYKESMD